MDMTRKNTALKSKENSNFILAAKYPANEPVQNESAKPISIYNFQLFVLLPRIAIPQKRPMSVVVPVR